MKKIIFKEHKDPGYAGRTKVNASAHATIAIAINFNSGGEKLTKALVESQKKIYFPVDISSGLLITDQLVEMLVKGLNNSLKGNLLDDKIVLNIAGNGIYTMKRAYSQQELDDYVYELLNKVIHSDKSRVSIYRIQTGGQTGIDEAGAKAGIRLGIDTVILCPKGWKFRNLNGEDISDEIKFKARFT